MQVLRKICEVFGIDESKEQNHKLLPKKPLPLPPSISQQNQPLQFVADSNPLIPPKMEIPAKTVFKFSSTSGNSLQKDFDEIEEKVSLLGHANQYDQLKLSEITEELNNLLGIKSLKIFSTDPSSISSVEVNELLKQIKDWVSENRSSESTLTEFSHLACELALLCLFSSKGKLDSESKYLIQKITESIIQRNKIIESRNKIKILPNNTYIHCLQSIIKYSPPSLFNHTLVSIQGWTQEKDTLLDKIKKQYLTAPRNSLDEFLFIKMFICGIIASNTCKVSASLLLIKPLSEVINEYSKSDQHNYFKSDPHNYFKCFALCQFISAKTLIREYYINQNIDPIVIQLQKILKYN